MQGIDLDLPIFITPSRLFFIAWGEKDSDNGH